MGHSRSQDFIIPRRRFIKGVTFALACCSLPGKCWEQTLLADLAPLATTTGQLRIRISDFPVLQNEFGSVRIAINPLQGNPPNGPTPDGTFYPIIVNRGAKNVFYALNSRCPHQNCAVDPGDGSSDLLICPCHTSLFGIDGRKLGGPTPSGLTKYTVAFDGQNLLTIQIPSLAYSVAIADQPSSGNNGPRLRLDFRTFRKVDYEIQFRESLLATPTIVPFSTSATGPTDRTVFSATSSTTVSVYVERKTSMGLYSVVMRIAEG